MSVQKSVSLSFDSFARVILAGFEGFDQAQANLSATVQTTMQRFVDHVSITLGKDQKACEALQKAIRECQLVIDADASGAMKAKTFTEYAQSAARALHFGIPFETQLKGKAEYKLPWSKSGQAKGAPAAGKAGKVETTDRAALDKTLSKALAQARLLGLTEFAANVLDLALESLDGFTETVLDAK
jgi:hypothetical protein